MSRSSSKRKANPSMHAAASKSRNLLDDTDSETEHEESNTTISRASNRSTPSASQRYASMLKRMRSHPVQDGVRKSQVDTVDVAIATATIQSPPTTPRQGAQGSRSVTSRRNVHISADFSPSPVAQLPTNHSQAMLPSASIQGDRNSLAAINAAASMDDACTLSGTEKGDAKSTRLLHNYFLSLQQSGTTRTIVEEKDLISSKLGLIFKKLKFINADTDLDYEGKIAKVLYEEMKIPDAFKAIWWEHMKKHVRKKLDERRSNCGAAVKKHFK